MLYNLVVALALVACVTAIPAIPSDYTTMQQNELMINQNSVDGPDGDVCCALSSNCKIQVEANSGTFFNSFTQQMTKFNIPNAGFILSDYKNKPQRQYTVQEERGGKIKCTYCPNEGNVTKNFMPDNAKDMGSFEVNGKPLEKWQWAEMLVVIQMELIDTYVNQAVNPPIPTQQNTTITPFGKYLGTEQTNFFGWKTGAIPASEFVIPGGTGQCQYGGDKDCNGGDKIENIVRKAFAKYKLSMEEIKPVPELKMASDRLKATGKPVQGVPTFSSDWSAQERNWMIENQNGIGESGGLECCGFPSNCKVQTSFDLATHYYSVKNNAERFDDVTQGATIVYDYTAGKGMEVKKSPQGSLSCENYCPIQSGKLTPFGIEQGMVDTGLKPYNGKNYQAWVVNQTGPFNITMETDTLYVDQSVTPAVPVFYEANITPFGIKLAQQTEAWTEFKGGDQPASLFKVAGMDNCPEANNCGNSMWQSMRLRTKDYNGYFKYAQINEQKLTGRKVAGEQ